ncbi:unnamed protein product [Chilo suppressalis]|uniref:Tetraspanin n=1 Tax=Chilo suppressalis TaxID=168631 RepID=A0ABN8AVT5_CHISP|nr:hypothetical protein evm_012054 [Chilo suppressalis]CAH0400272.1 unnamed protein product [Chilo suppressalis]
MCCCAEFIIKYVLFFANFVFSLAGLALIGVGIAVLVQISGIDALPSGLNAIPISVIVLGSIIFCIAFFGCCGAIRESQCLLTMYFICMAILAAGKIYLATVIFNGLRTLDSIVTGWVNGAFDQSGRPGFRILEVAFRCCGNTGPGAYAPDVLVPSSCCPDPAADSDTCPVDDAFERGCTQAVSEYFETFGEAIGGVLITVIIIELVAMLFGMFLCWSVRSNRR